MQLLVLSVSRSQACRFLRVIPEIDIWRAANLMLKRYGEKALEESAMRADELAAARDENGAGTCAGSRVPWFRSQTIRRPGRCTDGRIVPHIAPYGALLGSRGFRPMDRICGAALRCRALNLMVDGGWSDLKAPDAIRASDASRARG